MTEYWVSQGNKWCDFCKIYISNNPLSIRTHELGTRHKENVTKKLTTMKKESAAKEKEQKEAVKALEQIEAKATRSYQKDLAAFKEAKDSNQQSGEFSKGFPSKFTKHSKDWEYDAASGYYYNISSGHYYDTNSGLYYSAATGKWQKQEEVFPSSQVPKDYVSNNTSGNTADSKLQGGPPPGLVVSKPLNPMRSVKGTPSSIAVSKRKRDDGKQKVVSKEESAALKAREAARKRVEEREKKLLGLYKTY